MPLRANVADYTLGLPVFTFARSPYPNDCTYGSTIQPLLSNWQVNNHVPKILRLWLILVVPSQPNTRSILNNRNHKLHVCIWNERNLIGKYRYAFWVALTSRGRVQSSQCAPLACVAWYSSSLSVWHLTFADDK